MGDQWFGFAAGLIKQFLAGVAQLVEQLTCNQQVGGSSPFAGSFLPLVDDINGGQFFWGDTQVANEDRL